jgi:hypothetical protein
MFLDALTATVQILEAWIDSMHPDTILGNPTYVWYVARKHTTSDLPMPRRLLRIHMVVNVTDVSYAGIEILNVLEQLVSKDSRLMLLAIPYLNQHLTQVI